MLDNSTGLQLAGLASTGSWGYSPSNHRDVAALGMKETNGMIDGAAALIAAGRVDDQP